MTREIAKRLEQMKVSALVLLIALPCLIFAATAQNSVLRYVFGVTALVAMLPFFFSR